MSYEAVAGQETNDHGVTEAHTLLENLKSLQGTGNQVRLLYIEGLQRFHDDRLCYDLGRTSFHQFCDRELGLSKSTAYEYVRVSTALERLPRLRALFGQGELSWEQARSITRVATVETEVQWIELAWEIPVRELLAEVKEANRTGRSAPREKRHGLPNLLAKLSIDVTLEEKERIRAAFARVTEALDGEKEQTGSDPRPTLLRWADGILSGAIPDGSPDRREGGGADKEVRPTPAQTIVYQSCPECRSATVHTDEGAVQVMPERIEQLASQAKRVHIAPEEEIEVEVLPAGEQDAPNSARLAGRVLHRDGLRCANPGCGSQRNLHAHHIVFRSKGGPTVLANEVTVCDTCHAAIHEGIVDVRGSLASGLEWCPRPRTPAARIRDAESLRDRLRELRSLAPPSPPRPGPASPTSRWRRRESEVSTDSDTEQLVSDLACGLTNLGFSKAEAQRRVSETVDAFLERGLLLEEGEVLRHAISGKSPT